LRKELARAKDPNDLPDFKAKAIVNLTKFTMYAAYKESVSVAETERAVYLDCTIVRLTTINNNPKSGKARGGYLDRGEMGLRASHADLAEFKLKQVLDTKYLRQAPVLSN